MTRGIREYVNEKFASLLPQRAELGNTKFRAAVMQDAMTVHGISLASAATHYNHTLKFIKETDPTLVEGLGRPDDKKGGRKPIHTVQVVKVKDGEAVGERMSMEKAKKLVLASQEKGKVKLMIKEEAPVEPVTSTETAAPVDQVALDTSALESTEVEVVEELAQAAAETVPA